jgi:hypothetical protein
MDHLVGGERAGRQAGENDESKQNGLVHGISLGIGRVEISAGGPVRRSD